MRACLHRGANQNGGTGLELESGGERLAVEVGLPLDVDPSPALLPDLAGLRTDDASLLALVISHAHQDHDGLARYVRRDLPVLVGEAAHRILAAAAFFGASGHEPALRSLGRAGFEHPVFLRDAEPLQVGPFRITPFLVDHAACDAYSLLIEADGRRLFTSGDLRVHERKAALFERLVREPPRDLHALLLEGTTLGRGEQASPPVCERDLERAFVATFRATAGMALVWTSGQNLDRIVTIFRACLQTGRQMIMDLYTAEVLRATGNARIPQGLWTGVRVFLPRWQKEKVKRAEAFAMANRYHERRIHPDALAAEAERSVLLFRPSMSRDLEDAACLQGARMIHSLWSGYLKDPRQRPFLDFVDRNGLTLQHLHASDHASPRDLQRLARALKAERVVPLRTDHPDRYAALFERVEAKGDGVWWEV